MPDLAKKTELRDQVAIPGARPTTADLPQSKGGPKHLDGILSRLGVEWRDLRDRSMFFASLSIATSLAMAAWKIGAAILTGVSLFWLVNAAFSLGLAAARYLAVSTHRRPHAGAGDAVSQYQHQRRIYRITGLTLVGLAGLYITSCFTTLSLDVETQKFSQNIGIAIATLTFTELGLAIHGLMSARRNADLLVEVVKLGNLAGALILLVLTQSALMSFSQTTPGNYTGAAGITFGSVVIMIGLYMLVRRLPASDPSKRLVGPQRGAAESAM